MKHIVLDSSPLGLLSLPTQTAEAAAIGTWAENCLSAGHSIYLPEVIDYELRRELLRAGKTAGLTKLNALKAALFYLPITTDAMLRAAALWAQSRQRGLPTGDSKKLDVDVILAGQALTLTMPAGDVMIATANVGHLSRFVSAALWSNITP